MIEFTPFPKMPRLNRDIVITEKIDGTNASVYIPPPEEADNYARKVMAGSRNRWLEPGSDNFGFAAWVEQNWEELLKLGPGQHFGEWWGKGIQRGYGLEEKRFSLFNTARWNEETKPACCHVVPVLYSGMYDSGAIKEAMVELTFHGSKAVPGFMKPEGITIYHTAANMYFKVTCENDEKPKGQV